MTLANKQCVHHRYIQIIFCILVQCMNMIQDRDHDHGLI